MRAVVTGAAGFIGSHLTHALVQQGHHVDAVDCLTDSYDVARKRSHLAEIGPHPRLRVIEDDLLDPRTDLSSLCGHADWVFHLAGQPGVRDSWDHFSPHYVSRNIVLTQRLLHAVAHTGVQKFVFASSSSVYGDGQAFPVREDALPAPHSPYGVTKLAAEHLCGVYARNVGVPVVSLRYFTVYGPRQRPDMALHRLIRSALTGEAFPLHGDGSQVRDFTYVDDIVSATIAAAQADIPHGTVLNISSGAGASMHQVVQMVGEIVGTRPLITPGPAVSGDVHRTGADISLAQRLLDWHPAVRLHEGVTRQAQWQRMTDL